MIGNDSYLLDTVLARETDAIFHAGFQFACLLSEVAQDKQFVCVEHVGSSIVIQNFAGELRAFENICTHRLNRIQYEPRGQRPLSCRYHGWTFNKAGCPIGVADRVAIGGEPVAQRLALRRYRIETCGAFVFICREDHDGELRDFLGVFHEVLAEISPFFGAETAFGHVSHAANWKLLVENVLDNYHCGVLHRESFVEFGFCRKPAEDTRIDGPHSSWHVPRVPIARETLRKRALSHLSHRGYAHDSFFHVYIFPNLFVASTEGMSFYIGHALPTGPGTSELRYRYLAPELELTEKQQIYQNSLNLQTNASGLRIIEEDRPVLENIQRNMRLSKRPGVHVRDEPRIEAFYRSYINAMALKAT